VTGDEASPEEREAKYVTLKRGESVPFHFVYAPRVRQSAFAAEVNLLVLGMTRRLLLLAGGCLGVGLRFDTEKIDFGGIIESSTLTRSILLQNIGDVACKFAFNTALLGSHYSISPSEGQVPANNNLPIQVTFHPRRVGGAHEADFARHIPCLVDDVVQATPESPSGLVLHVSGSCEAAPSEGGVEVRFESVVRSSAQHAITIVNDTQSRWSLRPTFRNPLWSGEPTIDVPAGGRANYTITYSPVALTEEQESNKSEAPKGRGGRTLDKRPSLLKGSAQPAAVAAAAARKDSATASKESARRPGSSSGGSGAGSSRPRSGGTSSPTPGSPVVSAATVAAPSPFGRPRVHEGSLFLPLPTGAALHYRLIGIATPAPVEDVIEVSTQAKRTCVVSVPVKNWLQSYQRFRVQVDRGANADPSTTLTGPPSLDVPGLLERSYKLNFYAYKEGVTSATVSFINDTTGESLVYELRITAKDSFVDEGALAPMSASVRQLVTQHLLIANPMAHSVSFHKFSCTHPAITVPVPFSLPANSEGGCEVRFRPLVAHKEQRVVLSLFSEELGEFQYALTLSAAGVGTERSLRFATDLGHDTTHTFRFTSYATKPPGSLASNMEYEVRTSGKEFSVDAPRIAVPFADPLSEGVPVGIEVRYEPSAVGEVRDMLVVSPVPLGGPSAAAATGAAGGSERNKDKSGAAAAGAQDPALYASLTSGNSSEYTCLLLGTCSPPKPAGPVLVSTGAGTSVRFKNVLASSSSSAAAAGAAAGGDTFVYSVDNPAFILSKKTERLLSKQSTLIQIAYRPEGGDASMAAAGSRADRKKASATKAAAAAPARKRSDGGVEGSDSESAPGSARPGSSGGSAAAAAGAAAAAAAPAMAAGSIGKLTITCSSVKNVSWVTYLQGTTVNDAK
jgi:hypothetical protein